MSSSECKNRTLRWIVGMSVAICASMGNGAALLNVAVFRHASSPLKRSYRCNGRWPASTNERLARVRDALKTGIS